MLEYKRLSSSKEDCKIVDEYFGELGQTITFSNVLCRQNRHCKTENTIGVGLFDKGIISGFIGIIIWPDDETTISCLTTGSLLPKYRGKGIGKQLFKQAIDNAGDVVVDFSPTENVHQMLLKKFDGWHPFFKYQLWINCGRIPMERALQYDIDYKKIEENVPEKLAILIKDHINTKCRFILLHFQEKELLIGYRVAYNSKLFSALEIIYVSDKDIFDRNLDIVAKTVGRVGKKKYVLVDSCFFDEDRFRGVIEENCAGSRIKKIKRITKLFFKKYILVPSRRICYEKNGEPYHFYKNLGYLYSELCMEESNL